MTDPNAYTAGGVFLTVSVRVCGTGRRGLKIRWPQGVMVRPHSRAPFQLADLLRQ